MSKVQSCIYPYILILAIAKHLGINFLRFSQRSCFAVSSHWNDLNTCHQKHKTNKPMVDKERLSVTSSDLPPKLQTKYHTKPWKKSKMTRRRCVKTWKPSKKKWHSSSKMLESSLKAISWHWIFLGEQWCNGIAWHLLRSRSWQKKKCSMVNVKLRQME